MLLPSHCQKRLCKWKTHCSLLSRVSPGIRFPMSGRIAELLRVFQDKNESHSGTLAAWCQLKCDDASEQCVVGTRTRDPALEAFQPPLPGFLSNSSYFVHFIIYIISTRTCDGKTQNDHFVLFSRASWMPLDDRYLLVEMCCGPYPYLCCSDDLVV